MELKEGMVFRFKNNYYVLALICDGQYLMLSDDESYGWDLHESPNYEQIISSKVYNGYVPVCNGKERKFVTGWWYGATQLESTFRYVSDLEEVKHHFIVKDNMLDLYLRVKDDIGISFYGVTSVQKYNVGDKVKICDKKKMKDYIDDKDHDIIYEMIESFTKIFKDKPKETMSLRTAMEYAELINDKVEEILQILDFLDNKGIDYTLTDDYFEVSVDNRHYTVTFSK